MTTRRPLDRVYSASHRIEAPLREQERLCGALAMVAHALEQHAPPQSEYQKSKGISAPLSGNAMTIETGHRSGALVFADISTSNPQDPLRLSYVPQMDLWARWHPTSTEPIRYYNQADVVYLLSEEVGDQPFGKLMDTARMTGGDVVHAFAQTLRPKAKIWTRRKDYTISTIGEIDSHYIGETDVSLTTTTTNRQRSIRLGVSALYNTDLGAITKQYEYAVSSDRYRKAKLTRKGEGAVTLSTNAGAISPNLLDAYARSDQHDNEPLAVLHAGLEQLTAALLSQPRKRNS